MSPAQANEVDCALNWRWLSSRLRTHTVLWVTWEGLLAFKGSEFIPESGEGVKICIHICFISLSICISISIYAGLQRDILGFIPGHHNRLNITVKGVT